VCSVVPPKAASCAASCGAAALEYIGRETDTESNLGFFGVRLYDPTYGRFMSVDPLWAKYAPLQPYHYAGNEPVGRYDLFGFGVAEVNALAKKVDPALSRLYAEAVGKMTAAGGDQWFEFAATITSSGDGAVGLQHISWTSGTEANAQLTPSGTWDSGPLPGLLGSAHSHSIPAVQGETELLDRIPPGAKDLISTGETAMHFGEAAAGFVSFVYAGSVNFAVEVADPTKAAAHFSNKDKVKGIISLFSKASTPDDIREIIMAINKMSTETGIVIYESKSTEVDYQEVK